MSEEELRKLIEQDTKNHNAMLDRQAIQWLENQERLAKRMIKDYTTSIEQGKRMTCTRDEINTKAVPRISSYRVSESLQEFFKGCNLTSEQAVKIIKETPMTTSEDGRKGTGVDYFWVTDEQPVQYSKVEPEPDNNLPPDYSIPLIDNYEAYKLIEVLTEILDEVRAINRKLKKKVKK